MTSLPAGGWDLSQSWWKTRCTLQHHCPPRSLHCGEYYLHKGRKSVANTDNIGLFYITKLIMESAAAFLSCPPYGRWGERRCSLSVSVTGLLPTPGFNNAHCLFTDREVLIQNGSNVLLICFSRHIFWRLLKLFLFLFFWLGCVLLVSYHSLGKWIPSVLAHKQL